MVTLDAQMQSLRKQVRQATRYRNLNDHIRKAEGALFLIRWTHASEEMAETQRLLEEAEVAVSPGIGFGEHGEGYVRIALCENTHRIRQAIRNIRRFLSQADPCQEVPHPRLKAVS